MTTTDDPAMHATMTGTPPRDSSPFAARPGPMIARLRSAEAARAKAEAQLAAMRRYGVELETRHLALLRSTTWLALEPVRRAMRSLKRKSAPPPFAPRLLDGRFDLSAVRRGGSPEVRRYIHHLWGGLSRPAVRELTRILADEDAPFEDRFQAGHKLCTWLFFDDAPGDALAALQRLDAIAPGLSDVNERWMKEGFIRLASGDVAGARAAFERIGRTADGDLDPDAGLALANCLDSDEERLAGINAVLEQKGFAPLRLIDPERPLALDNIRGAPTTCRLPGLGRVSVIVPVYNMERMIRTAVRSLIEQSYRDLEIILVDDASSDGSWEVMQDLAREDARIVLLSQEVNAGAYVARNRGLEVATGAYVTTHDGDDWSHPQKIEAQLAELSGNSAAAGVCCHWVRVRPSLHVTPNWRIGRRILYWSHSSFLFRRELVDVLGGWDPVRVGADSEFIRRVAAKYGPKAVANIHADVPLAFAVDEDSSLTRTRLTHVRTVYFGLRQIYHAIARAEHARPGGLGPEGSVRRVAIAPAEMFGARQTPRELDFLLMGDCADAGMVAQMRKFIEELGAEKRVGVFHWPNFAASPADLCSDYCGLLRDARVAAVLPGSRLRLTSRYGVFFGWNHAEVDHPPEIMQPDN